MERLLRKIDSFFARQVTRKGFLKACLVGLAYFVFHNMLIKLAFAQNPSSNGRPKSRIKGAYDLVIAEGDDPYKNTVKAVEAMGGMERFVKKGSIVTLKPNISWDRTPEQAGNTNPQVVAALIDFCYKAGAKRVNIFDNTCQEARRCYITSQIPETAKEHGAYVYHPDEWNVVKMHLPYKSPMEGWPVFKDAVKCDTFISAPVLKHHGLTGLTISMKNLMGICSGKRGLIHVDIDRKLVDLTDFISPDLVIVDATRVLVRNGPSGGNLEDVVTMNKIVAATDSTLADAFASTLVGKDPLFLGNVRTAVERGYGSADIEQAKKITIKA
ncbi:MAG: DUF362 domain-containing protein [Candidatus Omnitrophota bacterium]